MPAEELQFRVAFDGPLADFTRRNPHAHVSVWCDWTREVLEIGGASEEEVARLRATLLHQSAFVETFSVSPTTHVLVMDCIDLPHDFVYRAVDDARCVLIPPTRCENGWEQHTVMSFGEDESRRLFLALKDGHRDVQLLRQRPLARQPLLSARSAGVPALLAGLTDRQVDALLLAARHGMYDSPRRTTAASIADGVGLSRSTFEEHLRKAENRLVRNLVPYLELAAKARRAGAEPAAAPPSP